MRLLVILGGLAVVVMGVLIALVVIDQEGPPEPAPEAAPDRHEAKPKQAHRKFAQKRPPTRRQPPGKREEQKEAITEKTVMRFGQEFEQKWREDRKSLGEERHKAMEQLWFQGRRPRGNLESIQKLEQILKEYPDTNRAGCAALELGHHYLKNRALDAEARRKRAEEYWRMVDERYSQTLCEYNANPDARSKLALATWIYRSSDPAKARRLLEEILDKYPGETDHLGQPLEVTARRLLEKLK